MARFLLRRLLIIPIALLVVNFLGYAYALLAWWLNMQNNPFVASTVPRPPIMQPYLEYLRGALRGNFGEMPFARGTILETIQTASTHTLGLLAIAFIVSIVLGTLIGLRAIRTNPPSAAPWLIPISTVGIAMPSFYIGMVAIAVMVLLILKGFPRPPRPFQGFGWDRHLVLPVLALAIRPTVQIAQVSSRLLADELHKQYVIASRSMGYSWRRIRWHTALSNILAALVLTVAGSFRVLVGELILVEWLFNWGGLGRLLGEVLVPQQLTSSQPSPLFLNPPLLAALLTAFAVLFLLADLIASVLIRIVDPRLRIAGEEGAHG